MKTMNYSNSFALRRVFGPYIIYPIVIALIIIVWIPYVIRTHDLGPIEAIGFCILLIAWMIYFNTRYRIWWRDGAVVMTPAGFPWALVTISIRVDDIKGIRAETSDAQTLLKMNRPFRRLTIYTDIPDRLHTIDVSLKHFNLYDVRRLMKVIHECRPDLEMPKGWV